MVGMLGEESEREREVRRITFQGEKQTEMINMQ